MPSRQRLHEDDADEGIHVGALSVDSKGPAVVRRFIDQKGYTFPVAMAGADLQTAYGGIRSIPTTFIIGPDGKVAEQMVGAHPMADYLAAARRAQTPGEG
ncbi:TlpA family protein disulfide reductase [bacterium]|nr:TlpA family protein disulfide reductase [bacterium]